MIKQLSIRFVLFLLAVLSLNTAKAQFPATINSAYATSSTWVTAQFATPGYVTFDVENTNTYPVRLNAVNFYHVALLAFTGGPNYSMNGGTYSLWYTTSQYVGVPNISTTNSWNLAKTGTPVTTAANGITEVISDVNLIIPPAGCAGNRMRFALVLDDTMMHAYQFPNNPYTPATYSNTGVVLTSSSANIYMGIFPSTPAFSTHNQTFGTNPNSYTAFRGGIKVDTNNIVPPKPTVTATPNPVCFGDSVTLEAIVPNEVNCVFPNLKYTWTWAGGQDTGKIIKKQVNETLIYNCTVSWGSKQSDPASIKVVMSKPEPPLVTGKFNYCVNDQFEPVTVIGDSALWYYSAAGGAPLPIAPTINTTLGPQKDTFYVAEWSKGCIGDRTMVIFTAANKPVAPIVESPLYKCQGEPSIPLEATGQNLVWYYFPTGGVPSVIPPTPPTSIGDTLSYFVAQDNDGCQGPRAQIDVFVVFKPNGLIVPSRERVCEGDTLTFSYYGSAFDGSVYIWEVPKEAISVDPIAGPGPIVVRFNQPGLYDFVLQVGNGDCFSPKYTQAVQVDGIPKAEILAKQYVCEDVTELVTLQSYDEDIDHFAWNFGASGVASHFATDQGPYGVTWSEAGEPVIELIITKGACADTLYDTIEVRKAPDAGIGIDIPNPTGVYCAGDSIRVRARTIDGGSVYTWTPNRYFDEYANEPAAYAIVDFTSYVKLNVKDQFGCISNDSVQIKTEPCCKLTFPTAFSPNNDGRNDRFHLLNVNNLDNYNRTNALNYDVKNFRVVNRWGVTVFESNNEIRGWDGNFNGEPQDMGTYYWFISYMCGGKLASEKGEVVLVR